MLVVVWYLFSSTRREITKRYAIFHDAGIAVGGQGEAGEVRRHRGILDAASLTDIVVELLSKTCGADVDDLAS